VLAARARRSERVDADVGRIDLDLDRVVDLGIDEQAGEARVRPPAESNGLFLTSRCTPVSVRSRPYA
jgi:hypothetical protein